MGDRTYAFDANNVLADGAAAATANGYLQSGGAQGIVDLGGNQGVTITAPSIADVATLTPQQARGDFACVIDVSAIKISSADERYTIKVLGSNKPDFSSGVVSLGGVEFGKGAAGVPATQADGLAKRYEILFTNEQANVKYQYVTLWLTVAGTTPSLTLTAFIAELPEM